VIPSVCPSESGISIIDIGYLVVFDLGIGGSTAAVDMEIPIQIGLGYFLRNNFLSFLNLVSLDRHA